MNNHLVDDLALLGVSPVLLPALPVARGHLHLRDKRHKGFHHENHDPVDLFHGLVDLLEPLGEGRGHLGAAVFPPQLVLLGEGEELGAGHEVVAGVLPQLVGILVVVLQVVEAGGRGGVLEAAVGEDVLGVVQDELLRVDVLQEPRERLALQVSLELQPEVGG